MWVPTRTEEQLRPHLDVINQYDVVVSNFLDQLPPMPSQTRSFLKKMRKKMRKTIGGRRKGYCMPTRPSTY